MSKEIYITVTSNEEDTNPEYIYYDKNLDKLVTTDNIDLSEYLINNENSYKTLKFPYTIGIFQANKLISYYGKIYPSEVSIPGVNKLYENSNIYFERSGSITDLNPFLTIKQTEHIKVYKLIDIRNKQSIVIKNNINNIDNTYLVEEIFKFIDREDLNISIQYMKKINNIITLKLKD